MSSGKHKSGDGDCCLLSEIQKPTRVELDCILWCVMHRYNPLIVAKCMASFVNNCIHVPFVTR